MLFAHLIEILNFFIRQHLYRSKFFIAADGLPARIAQLLACPQKHLKLSELCSITSCDSAYNWTAALKFFRTSIGLQDSFFNEQVTKDFLFQPILNIVFETMPRDNLLNSACLELFEFIKRENLKPIITHIVENYREKLEQITYVNLFQELILRYDQMQGYNPEMEGTLFGQEDDSTPARTRMNGAQRWQGVRELDPAEEEYFNTSDDEDELAAKPKIPHPTTNGTSPLTKPLVDYPDDDDETTEIKFEDLYSKPPNPQNDSPADATLSTPPRTAPTPQTPPERLSEKRRREEDEEDELGKLSSGVKRRSSSISSITSTNSNASSFLRRKKSFTSTKDPNGGKKIAISLALKNPIETEHGGDDGG